MQIQHFVYFLSLAIGAEKIQSIGDVKNEVTETFNEDTGYYTLDDEANKPLEEVKDLPKEEDKNPPAEKVTEIYNEDTGYYTVGDEAGKSLEEVKDLPKEEETSEKKDLPSEEVKTDPPENVSVPPSPPYYLKDIDPESRNAGRNHRISFSHREGNGIGYPTGYSSLDLFFSHASSNELITFADLRGHYFNDGQKAANVGIGMRAISDRFNVVLGGNVFYDYRRTRHSTIHQIGAGLEVLGTLWDVRVNGYFPVHNQKHLYTTQFFFAGHRGFFRQKLDVAFTGVDALVSRLIYKRKYIDLQASAGAYYFHAPFGKNAVGGLLRATAYISPYIALEAQGSYDSVFKAIGQGQISLIIPFGGRRGCPKCNECPRNELSLEERLVDAVSRFEIIVADKHKRKALALNPVTGVPYYFVFVNNTSPDGNGTFEDPFGTLLAAQINSSPGDVIYTFPGDGTTFGMNAGIILQNNQIFQGSGTPLLAGSSFGNFFIPPQTPNSPSIDNTTGGNTVTLANNNTVNGFNISSSGGGFAISGSSITNAIITNNLMTSGINLLNSGGNILIDHNGLNILTGVTGIAITNGSGNLQITNNSVTTNGSSNAIVITSMQGNVNISSNSIFNAMFGIGLGGTLNISFALNNNSINQISGGSNNNGIEIGPSSGTSSGSINNNQISNISNDGIKIAFNGNASISLVKIENNMISNAGAEGVLVQQSGAFADFINLKLAFNQSNLSTAVLGYNLFSNGVAPFLVQSPNLMLSGVQGLNLGTFMTTGPITFIPFDP